MKIHEYISCLKNADIEKVSFKKLIHIILQNNIHIPYTTIMLKKGAPIERGRINENNRLFKSEFEISYRTDLGNISEFGRANKPFQSMFYGSLPSEDIKSLAIVLFAELVEQFRNVPETDFETNMTIGRWFVKEDFEVADVCFSEDYFTIEEIKTRYDFWITKTKNDLLGQKEYQDLLQFFSKEFSKTQINTHFDYKLSSFYTEIAINANKLNGISYPSVKTDYSGRNIALTPDAVEKYLELKEVAVFKFIVDKGKPLVLQTHYSDSLGPFNSEFKWKKYT